MKLCRIVTIGLFCILMAGCSENAERSVDNRLINTKLVNILNDIAMENAIVSQHTLFPYHFVKNGPELNELGQNDLAILARHFMEHPGHLNVRQNEVPADIYGARVNLVLDRLKEAGINIERRSISDGMPGGSSMASERILVILENAETAPAKTTTIHSLGNR